MTDEPISSLPHQARSVIIQDQS